jgi:spore coat protein U-like protein
MFYTQSANARCSITAASGVSFGAYDVFSLSDLTGTGSFAVTGCTRNASRYVARLSRGSSNSYTFRTMLSGSDSLNYNLYTNATYTSVWGNNSGNTDDVQQTNSGNGVGPTITIYGKIPAGQDVPAGSYNDNITITITF